MRTERRYQLPRWLYGSASALLLLCAIVCLPLSAASFDCKKAKSKVEKMICGDAELSKLDDGLSERYLKMIHTSSERERYAREYELIDLRKAQKTWLKQRNACKDKLCVEVMYRTRLYLLTDAAGPSGSQTPGNRPRKFYLTYGHGVRVCEAYLERLNRSQFEHHPKCDRPEDDNINGFQKLNRVKLSAEELQRFWAPTYSFLHSGRPSWPRTDETDRRVKSELEYFPVFRYEVPVDVDNDGAAEPIVFWRNGKCGATYHPSYMPEISTTIAIVLNAAGDGPNVERTRQLFGHPSGAYRSSRFRSIGMFMGIFQFDGLYYVDTFFDSRGDFSGYRQNDANLGAYDAEIANRLAVFLRRDAKTKQVCEYWLYDPEERTRIEWLQRELEQCRQKRLGEPFADCIFDQEN